MGVGLALVAAVLGGSAIALTRAPDFGPFTMTITEWTDAIGSREPGVVIPGTIVTRLEYRTVRDWRTTTLFHSLDSSYEGSTHVVRNEERGFFDALTRVTSRRVAVGEVPEVPDRWLIPKLIDELPARGFVASPDAAPGTVLFVQRESVPVPATRDGQPRGSLAIVTRALFNMDSGLPLSVEVFVNGTLRSSTKYEVTSRP